MSGLSGAEYLASIFGTEKDKVNCSFFFKIGACRHGDKCSRLHNKPTFSQTILLQNLYQQPNLDLRQASAAIHFSGGGQQPADENAQQHFDEFFEEVFCELEEQYGEIEEMNVCDNLGEHMIGNVYVKFRMEEDATKAEDLLNNRWFGGNPVYSELSPVTDFREACCRQYEMGECSKGGFCNFMHLKPISRELRRKLYSRRRQGAGYFGGGNREDLGDRGGGGGGGGGGGRGACYSCGQMGHMSRDCPNNGGRGGMGMGGGGRRRSRSPRRDRR